MHAVIDTRVLELLVARLCHELVSPIGAIANGVELLGEEDPEFVRDAVDLIGQSARKAGKRLQFYRFAYGSSTGSMTVGTDARELLQGLLEGGKVTCDWPAEAMTLALDWHKLAVNLLVLAAEALPRGGSIALRPKGAGIAGIDVVAKGDSIVLGPEARAAIADKDAIDGLTSRTIHAFFTARLAEQIGAKLTISAPAADELVFTAVVG